MNKPNDVNLSRRTFLQSSAAVAGSLVVGVYLPTMREAKAASGGLANTWIRVAPNNEITVLVARSEMGQGVHTSMTALVAEELEVPLSAIKIEFAPAAMVYANALMTVQITGGSTSVREAYDKLRVAGAATRTVLLQAAATRLGVTAGELVAADGKITHKASGKSLTYGEVAEDAAKLPLPEKPALKPASQFKIVGKESLKRTDTVAKVKAQAVYGIDVKLPGLMIAVLEQCPVIGGKPLSFDAAAALKMPGVAKVVQISDGVAVVAKDYWTASKARAALKITWDEGPSAKVSTDSARKVLMDALATKGPTIRNEGDFAKVAGSGKKVSATYVSPYLAHQALEPVNCTAVVKDGKCRVIGPIQFQYGAHLTAAGYSGVKPEDATVETTFIGGGFGRKLELDFVRQAVEIAVASGLPVKLIWSREDDTRHDFYRPMSVHQMTGILDNGKLIGFSSKMASGSPTARAFPPFFQNGVDPFMNEGSHNVTYNVPNLNVETVVADTGVRIGYWRSVSNALNAFAIESFMDELAASAGKDPVDFRLAALDKAPRAANVLKLAAEKSGYKPGAKMFGVAQMECYGTYSALVVELESAGEKPKIKRITMAVDAGVLIHPDQVRAQAEGAVVMALAAALQQRITLDKGRVIEGNFDKYPFLRAKDVPPIAVHLVASSEAPGGMGEVGVPLVAPALANAIANASGRRVRELPIAPVKAA